MSKMIENSNELINSLRFTLESHTKFEVMLVSKNRQNVWIVTRNGNRFYHARLYLKNLI